jgi:hypothetical protein
MTKTVLGSRQLLIETRRFYFGLSVLLAILALIGFWPRYFRPLLTGTLETEAIIHIHATVYVGWLALFVFQCLLVATGNIRLHRRIGNFGLVYGCVLILVGLATTFVRFAARLSEGGIEAVQHTALAPLTDMVIFAAFFGAAAYHRNRPELHKRLMIVAASSILIPSIARFVGSFELEPVMRHTVRLALWLSPILLAMAFDFYRRRIIHPVYVIGAVAIVLFNFRRPLQFTDTWVRFTHWLASVIS